MSLFFDASLSSKQDYHLISEEESRHILRVLRKKIGDQINLTNGQGDLFEAEISGVKSKRCEVKINNHKFEDPLPYRLHIAIAPTKSSDKFEFFLEKATEIGITEITPLLCDNSERKRLNLKRCEKILQSAMKQSQRLYLPKLNEMIAFQKFMDKDFTNRKKLIAHCEDAQKIYVINKFEGEHNFCSLIGPEGDFSPEEIQIALSKGFEPVSLGEKRLRTETAGLVIPQALALKYRI